MKANYMYYNKLYSDFKVLFPKCTDDLMYWQIQQMHKKQTVCTLCSLLFLFYLVRFECVKYYYTTSYVPPSASKTTSTPTTTTE